MKAIDYYRQFPCPICGIWISCDNIAGVCPNCGSKGFKTLRNKAENNGVDIK